MLITRSQWPHTIEDITKSLEGVWGLVGATGVNGNLFRLERSLKEPLIYTLSEFKGLDEEVLISIRTYQTAEKNQAVEDFAKEIGF